MTEGCKCVYCPNCPYYEITPSYGTERVECGNYNCSHYDSEYAEESDKNDKQP